MPATKRGASAKTNPKRGAGNGAPLGFEEKLWAAADKMRGHMDAAEYKHVVLGLIFLKYISDAFEERHVYLLQEAAGPRSDYYVREERARYAVAEDRDEYSDWGGERVRDDVRWTFGSAPLGNANYAWVQHIIHHLSPHGVAGFVLANGSMSSNQSGEGEIRKAIVEADLVDCMIALPGRLFYTTQIPACLWFLSRSKSPSPVRTGDPLKEASGRGGGQTRDRRGQVLFIDARKLGSLVDRTHRDLSDDELARIARTYHAWRGEYDRRGDPRGRPYEDVRGFCRSATLDEIASHGYVLTPGRYVGAEEAEDDDEPFDEKVKRLTIKLDEQFRESAQLEQSIRENLRRLNHGR